MRWILDADRTPQALRELEHGQARGEDIADPTQEALRVGGGELGKKRLEKRAEGAVSHRCLQEGTR